MRSASQLNRDCGYVSVLSKTRIRPPSQVRALNAGTSFHAAVEAYYKNGVVPGDELKGEPRKWFDMLTAAWSPPVGTEFEVALGLGENLKYTPVTEPEPHVYVSVDGSPLLTAGRADCVFYDTAADTATAADWKTGRYEVEHPASNLQLWSLALAFADSRKAGSVRTAVYYARTGQWKVSEVYRIGDQYVAERIADVHAAALLDDTPRTGVHCADCWERKNCKAFMALGRAA